jgi:hypothetical protein
MVLDNKITGDIAAIRFDLSYFKDHAKNEYAYPVPWIWIREAFQNAVDAGAKNIKITVTEDTVTFEDDGCGMTDEIILNKLLVLGGSYKGTSNATGGFGEAKKILFFCWEYWSITSCPDSRNKYYLNNTMLNVSPIKHTGHKTPIFEKGTTIEIKYDPTENKCSMNDWIKYTRSYIATCSVKTKVTLNGNELEMLQMRGKKKSYDWCDVCINKSNPADYIYIRINGITMFMEKINIKLKATITIDLKGTSIERLSTSRERLRYPYDSKMNSIVQSFVVDPVSSMRKHNEKIYMDEYRARSKKIKHILENIEDQDIKQEVRNIVSDFSNENTIVEEIAKIDPGLAAQIRIELKGIYESKLGYPFRVRRDNKQKPYPEPLGHKSQCILHCWKYIVDAIMNEEYPYRSGDTKYMVGLTYVKDKKKKDDNGNLYIDSPGIEAEYIYTPEEDIEYILINPTYVKKYNNPLALGHYLFIHACHEIAHIEYDKHDESFSIHWNTLMKKFSNDTKFWLKLFKTAKNEFKNFDNDITEIKVDIDAYCPSELADLTQ